MTLAGHLSAAGSFRGLCSPMALAEREIRFTRVLPARHLPRPGFGYPLRGLLPRDPGRACFSPAAPWGFSLRSLLLAAGWPAFLPTAPRVPLPQTSLRQTGVSRSCGPQTGFRVLPGASPLRAGQVFSLFSRRMLPWAYSLSGVFRTGVDDRFRPPPPTCLAVAAVTCNSALAPRSLDPPKRIPTARAGNPSQGFAPQSPWRSACPPARAMCSPRGGCRVTAA